MRRSDLLLQRLERFTRILPGVEAGEVRAVHRLRVASRRLRELLPVLQIEPAVARKLGRRLRKIRRGLGPVRELDVLQGLVTDLQTQEPEVSRGLDRIQASVREARLAVGRRWPEEASPRVLGRLARRLAKVARDLEAVDPAPREPRVWRWALGQINGAGLGHRGLNNPGPSRHTRVERLHRVRISVKKLRYAVELRAEASGAAAGDDLAALERMQERLGQVHDMQVLIDRVRGLQATLAPRETAARGDLTALVETLDRRCRHLHARYVGQAPSILDICERLRARSSGRTSARRRVV